MLAKQFNDLRTYFLPNRIFLAESVCTIIDEILEVAKGIFFDITTFEVDPGHEEYRYNPAVLKERHQFWENARSIHKGKFTEVKAKFEREFRVILGIES